MSITSCYNSTDSKQKEESFQKDAISLQDAIDKWSEIGEDIGHWIHKGIVYVVHKTAVCFSFLFFGIVLGFVVHFFKCIFVGKNKQ